MGLTGQKKAMYLQALEYMGGKSAYKAGVELLKKARAGKPLPEMTAELAATAAKHADSVDAVAAELKLSTNWKKKLLCNLKCLPYAIAKDWGGLARCVFE